MCQIQFKKLITKSFFSIGGEGGEGGGWRQRPGGFGGESGGYQGRPGISFITSILCQKPWFQHSVFP